MANSGSSPARSSRARAEARSRSGPELADRLSLRVGDSLRIGSASLRIVGFIAEEPDRVGQGFTLGSTALVDRAGLAATGLVQPGSLYTNAYRIKLPPGSDVGATSKQLSERFRDEGFQVQDRSNGAPGTRRFIERLGQFLTLVGLTALVVAGIGVGNGVTSYLDSKRNVIATLKLLGATSGTIFRSYLLQIGIVALGAMLVGLTIGAMVPWIVTLVAGSALPVPPKLAIYPMPLLISAAYGLLIAVVFAILPLARARTVPAASLFRGSLESSQRPSWFFVLAVIVAAGLIAALAIATAREPTFAALFVGAALGLLLLLTLLGSGIRWVASKLPRPRNPLFRLALANLHRPAAQTGRLVVALGLGLTLFTTLAVIETNLSGQIRTTIPDKAPSFLHARHPCRGGRPVPHACHPGGAARRSRDDPLAPGLRRRCEGAARFRDGKHSGRRLVPARRPRTHLCARRAGGQPRCGGRVVAARLFRSRRSCRWTSRPPTRRG
jgi:putative ABC transport system permease protein